MRHKTFEGAVEAARRLQGWQLAEIAEQLGVSLHAVQSWLKPGATSRREAPSWAILSLCALAYREPVSERRGAARVTYEPATEEAAVGRRRRVYGAVVWSEADARQMADMWRKQAPSHRIVMRRTVVRPVGGSPRKGWRIDAYEMP